MFINITFFIVGCCVAGKKTNNETYDEYVVMSFHKVIVNGLQLPEGGDFVSHLSVQYANDCGGDKLKSSLKHFGFLYFLVFLILIAKPCTLLAK